MVLKYTFRSWFQGDRLEKIFENEIQLEYEKENQ
jgi:hypothetical protein